MPDRRVAWEWEAESKNDKTRGDVAVLFSNRELRFAVTRFEEGVVPNIRLHPTYAAKNDFATLIIRNGALCLDAAATAHSCRLRTGETKYY